jgi:hypothetical protein
MELSKAIAAAVSLWVEGVYKKKARIVLRLVA